MVKTIDIDKMSEVELKALAYDEIAILERAQNNIKMINARLASLSELQQKAVSEAAVDGKKEEVKE